MPSFSTERHVPFTADQMFTLVADVEHYPEFLPLCTGLSVISRRKLDDGDEIVAKMNVGYKAIAESFTTRVITKPATKRIDVSYLDGPFKRLVNHWTFSDDAAGTGCTIDFFIDYEFRSMLMGALVGGLFDQAFRRFASAFEDRAVQVYGRPSA
jgi:coenzyme Q-binding protein COQ10